MFAFTSGANVKVVYRLLIITLHMNYSEYIQRQCCHHGSVTVGFAAQRQNQNRSHFVLVLIPVWAFCAHSFGFFQSSPQ